MNDLMQIIRTQLDHYAQRIKESQEELERAKRALEHNRLQAKQVRAMIKLAHHHATLKAFIKAMPRDEVEVEPAPSVIYANVHLGCMAASLYRDVPDKLGLTLMETRKIQPESIASPVLRVYRCAEGNVRYYITEYINR